MMRDRDIEVSPFADDENGDAMDAKEIEHFPTPPSQYRQASSTSTTLLLASIPYLASPPLRHQSSSSANSFSFHGERTSSFPAFSDYQQQGMYPARRSYSG